MSVEYLVYNVNHIFEASLNEEEIEKIIDFNLKTEIYE